MNWKQAFGVSVWILDQWRQAVEGRDALIATLETQKDEIKRLRADKEQQRRRIDVLEIERVKHLDELKVYRRNESNGNRHDQL